MRAGFVAGFAREPGEVAIFDVRHALAGKCRFEVVDGHGCLFHVWLLSFGLNVLRDQWCALDVIGSND